MPSWYKLLAMPQFYINGKEVKQNKAQYGDRKRTLSTLDNGNIVSIKHHIIDPLPSIYLDEQLINNPSEKLELIHYAVGLIPIALIGFGGAIGGVCVAAAAWTAFRVFRSNHDASAQALIITVVYCMFTFIYVAVALLIKGLTPGF